LVNKELHVFVDALLSDIIMIDLFFPLSFLPLCSPDT
jgi:hypothetical protein